MQKKEVQRFGRVKETYQGFGELRGQKKFPHKEVKYISVSAPNSGARELRSVQNCSLEQIEEAIRYFTIEGLNTGKLSQEQTESLLDWCYAELHQRLEEIKAGELA
jgi:hypothetical protein